MTIVEEKKAAPKEEVKSQRQLELEELRRERIPAGIPSKSLDFPAREGYHRRVVKNDPGRLERFFDGGWRFVQKDELGKPTVSSLKITTRDSLDSCVSRVIGSQRTGEPSVGYLMEIPDELYQEDQAAKMERVDALEAGLRQGMTPDGGDRPGTGYNPSAEGQYIPSTGIKIDQKGRRR